jgi:Golgi nucleoside diphosphatase
LLVAITCVLIMVQLLSNSVVTTAEARREGDAARAGQPRAPPLSGHHDEPQYGIVIDAGSSGSRIHIFRFHSPRNRDGLPLINWPAAASLKQTPGLSTFAEPLAASHTLNPLLAFAAEHVRKSRTLFVASPKRRLLTSLGRGALSQSTETPGGVAVYKYSSLLPDGRCVHP